MNYCNVFGNSSFGTYNEDIRTYFNAEYNWWGDASGPWHPDSNPGGSGNMVSDFIDFIPWLDQPVGVNETRTVNEIRKSEFHGATIFSGPLRFPENMYVRIFDIAGRQIQTLNPAPGIYFIEVDGQIRQKVVKIR